MATDYDAPRRSAEEELETDSLEGLKAAEKAEPAISDTDDGEIVEPFELPMEEVSGEEVCCCVCAAGVARAAAPGRMSPRTQEIAARRRRASIVPAYRRSVDER